MTEPRSPHRRGLSALFGLALFAALGASWWNLRAGIISLQTRTAALEQALQGVERAVQLSRFERGSKGLGVTALLEQLRHWAPLLSLSTTPQREIPAVQERVEDLTRALEAVGADALPPLLAALQGAKPDEDDLRKWILTAVPRIDRERGLTLLEDCVRGLDRAISPRIRVHAANLLLELDKARLGKILGELLTYESATGIDATRLPHGLREAFAAARLPPQRMPMFFNFIDLFAATGANDVAEKLIMVAGRPDHDLATIQACVKQLGELRSAHAVKVLKRLYESPPEMMVNPIFQGHCLEAIGKIEGGAGCDYFKEMLRRGPDERVQAKLSDLIKTYCQ